MVASPKCFLNKEVSSGPFNLIINKNNQKHYLLGIVTNQKMKKPKFKVDKHILTPKHSKISDKEKAQILEKYHVTSKEMPKILKTDA